MFFPHCCYLLGSEGDVQGPKPFWICSGSKGRASLCMRAKTRETGGGFGHQRFVAMPQRRHRHQALGPGTARLTSVTIFPVLSRLSLYLVFLNSFQSQVSWGLGTFTTEIFGDACPRERVSTALGSLRSRAVAPLAVRPPPPPNFYFPLPRKLKRLLVAFLAFHLDSYNSCNISCPRSLLFLPGPLVLAEKKPCSQRPRKAGVQLAAIRAQLAAPRAVPCLPAPGLAVLGLAGASTQMSAQNTRICVFVQGTCCPPSPVLPKHFSPSVFMKRNE